MDNYAPETSFAQRPDDPTHVTVVTSPEVVMSAVPQTQPVLPPHFGFIRSFSPGSGLEMLVVDTFPLRMITDPSSVTERLFAVIDS